MITNREIGDNGRFGNQIFQYMFLSYIAEKEGISFGNPVWDGDDIFDIQPGRSDLPTPERTLIEDFRNPAKCPVRHAEGSFDGVDVSGYFQFPTAYYAPQKDRLLRAFAYRAPFESYARDLLSWFDALPGHLSAVHIRRGDYGTGIFFRAPTRWYVDWLARLQDEQGDITVFLASDDAASVLSDFDGFNVVTAQDAPKPPGGPGFLTDFMALSLAQSVAISNSSLSFAATMFNSRAEVFMRPSLAARTLIPYDPWDAPVLLYDQTAEDAGEEFMSARARSRSKYRIRKFFGRYDWQREARRRR